MPRRNRLPHAVARLAPVLIGGLALTGLAACSGAAGSPGPVGAVPQATPVTDRPAVTVTYALPADVADMVLPVTGEDTRWTQGLDAFGRLAGDTSVRRCLAERKVPAPPHEPPAFVRFSDIPDLPFIARHGFNGVIVPGSADRRGDRPAEGADKKVQDGCMAAGTAVGQDLHSLYGKLQSEWMGTEASLRTHPHIVAALRDFGPCMSRHEIDAPDENAFFALADQRLSAGDTAGEHTLATAYAACMAPAENTRAGLRKKLAERFRASHRNEITALNTSLPAKIHDLEEAYGIRISFPAL